MALSAFDDKSRRPDAGALGAVLGPASGLWRRLLDEAARRDPRPVAVWHFAGPRYGWSLRLKQKERIVLHLTPCDGHFLAGLVLGEKAIAAERANLPRAVLAVLDAAPRYAEGRGVRQKVATARDLGVVTRLLELKLSGASGGAGKR